MKIKVDSELIEELVEMAKRHHYYCEDNWYSCPKSQDGCSDDSQGSECNCGADKSNARLEEILITLLGENAEKDLYHDGGICV